MEIELTARAEADLIEIGDFIAKDSPAAAERFVVRLRHRIEVLREFPEAGHRIRSCTLLRLTGLEYSVSGTGREAHRKSRKFAGSAKR